MLAGALPAAISLEILSLFVTQWSGNPAHREFPVPSPRNPGRSESPGR
jgi:hypothetical protein